MKRNENLKTLSWEHHDGLVASFRLKLGLKKSANPEEMVKYIFHIWESNLEHHFWQEEQTLLNLRIEPKYIQQMKSEHERFRRLIENLKEDSKNINIIEEFAELLNKHIRFEERTLYPLVEKEIDSDKLNEIGKFLKEQHIDTCEVWNNEFWKN